MADRVQLQQVVANLVANAIEAMDTVADRARTLRVKSVIREPDGVLIMVEDSGPGIDPENVDRIFHPFFTTKSQGTGMGLPICRSIIEAHNGRLSVRPAADRGSVFQISLGWSLRRRGMISRKVSSRRKSNRVGALTIQRSVGFFTSMMMPSATKEQEDVFDDQTANSRRVAARAILLS